MRRSLLATCAILVLSGTAAPLRAEGDRLQPDFTFRRVGVPQSGNSGPRINVQIDPGAPAAGIRVPREEEPAPDTVARVSAGGPPPAPAPATPSEVAWFWQAVSPDLADSGPGRLAPALLALDGAPENGRFTGPALQGLADIAEVYGTDILRETVGTKVSPALVLAMISVESGGRADAISRAGAEGLMQLMPPTADRFGVSDSFDTAQNIRGGVAYLDWLMEEFDQDPIMVLAGYNAGEGSVRSHAGVPPFAETRAYVPKVLAAWEIARGLCLTPPELVSDGCVFAVEGQLP